MSQSTQDTAADTLILRRLGTMVLFMCGVAGGLVAISAAISAAL